MPQRPPKGCRKHGCTHLTTETHGYCKEHHQLASWGQWQKERGSSTQRGYGYAWQKLRKVVLIRDKYLCQVCLKAGRLTSATTVDHILGKAAGGMDELDNLQSLCDPCHHQKTAEK